MRQHRKKMTFANDMGDEDEYKDTENYLNRENVKGKLAEWLQQPHAIRYIHKTFAKFIKGYKDEDGSLIYETRIIDMSANNQQSLEINYNHLQKTNNYLAEWLIGADYYT